MNRTTPPYLLIVADIRQRITAGELRPGDRIPSARRIAQESGVAIATATKAHAVLRREGLTVVLPGIGTVVASLVAERPPTVRRRTPLRASDDELTRERIVRTAVEIADAEGMAELSMRRIATDLGVATMSLYRHVASKDELVLHMIDTAIGGEPLPPAADDCRAALEQVARTVWTVFRRHPWLAPAMSITRPQLASNALALADRVFIALDRAGLAMQDWLYVHLTIFSFIRGVATALEPEAEAQRETGLTNDEWMASQELRLREVASSGSPLLRLALHEDFDFDLDKLFEYGLARLLDGLEPLIGAESGGRP